MIKKCYNWLFAIPDGPRSWTGIIGWWELRRIPYNLIVGFLGLISLFFFFLFIHLAHELEPGEDAVEPIALLAAPFIINIAYTFGWLGELFLYFIWRQRSNVIGPVLYQLGLTFSIAVIFLPSVIWLLIWIVRSMA
jgi:hypothetical protein